MLNKSDGLIWFFSSIEPFIEPVSRDVRVITSLDQQLHRRLVASHDLGKPLPLGCARILASSIIKQWSDRRLDMYE